MTVLVPFLPKPSGLGKKKEMTDNGKLSSETNKMTRKVSENRHQVWSGRGEGGGWGRRGQGLRERGQRTLLTPVLSTLFVSSHVTLKLQI